MAPPKTMALGQQNQQPIGQGEQQAKQQANKPKNRKARRQQNELTREQQQQQRQQQASIIKTADIKCQLEKVHTQDSADNKQSTQPVPSERNPNTKKDNQSKTVIKETESNTIIPALIANQPKSEASKHQQLISDEPDEIDAGIELDGSSNSGSSVRDGGDDQLKSNSVSPVMNQTTSPKESPREGKTSQLVPTCEQNGNQTCNPVITGSSKRTTITREQLAQDRQVIEADEQQIQEKLEFKHKKSISQTSNSNTVSSKTPGDDKKDSTRSEQNSRSGRRFSSQLSQESQNKLCKVCEQHVYQMERMLAEKSIYHKQCFRCHQCKVQLRIDNYSSHEGQVYCKAHHRQLFQPQVKLDNDDDVDVVAKSITKTVDDYLLHRGRLSELKFLFLNKTSEHEEKPLLITPKPIKKPIFTKMELVTNDNNNIDNPKNDTLTGSRQRQMIICENEPLALPKDVVRSDTKVDDGIDQIKLNLNNILEKFERGPDSEGQGSQPSSASISIEKPSFNLKKTLMAFENNTIKSNPDNEEVSNQVPERPVVKKLGNVVGFLNGNSDSREESKIVVNDKGVAIKRSESILKKLKKYESRISGEKEDDSASDDDDNEAAEPDSCPKKIADIEKIRVPKLSSFDMSALKNKWESGDIKNKQYGDDDLAEGDKSNTGSPMTGKDEELILVRQQLARRKSGDARSVKNIYENALKEAQCQSKKSQDSAKSDSGDLSALNGFSTSEIQQQLLQNSLTVKKQDNPSTTKPNKDHFQLKSSNRANKLRERFELGLINNSLDDSDTNEENEAPAMTKLEQIRQEKLEDLSVFTDGEIKAREARNMFQQIDRHLSKTKLYTSQDKV